MGELYYTFLTFMWLTATIYTLLTYQ
jgi:hypothetical protein